MLVTVCPLRDAGVVGPIYALRLGSAPLAAIWRADAAGFIAETFDSASVASTIVAVSSPLTSPAAIPLAQAADAVLLCVEIGQTEIRQRHFHVVKHTGHQKLVPELHLKDIASTQGKHPAAAQS